MCKVCYILTHYLLTNLHLKIYYKIGCLKSIQRAVKYRTSSSKPDIVKYNGNVQRRFAQNPGLHQTINTIVKQQV